MSIRVTVNQSAPPHDGPTGVTVIAHYSPLPGGLPGGMKQEACARVRAHEASRSMNFHVAWSLHAPSVPSARALARPRRPRPLCERRVALPPRWDAESGVPSQRPQTCSKDHAMVRLSPSLTIAWSVEPLGPHPDSDRPQQDFLHCASASRSGRSGSLGDSDSGHDLRRHYPSLPPQVSAPSLAPQVSIASSPLPPPSHSSPRPQGVEGGGGSGAPPGRGRARRQGRVNTAGF
jgi:hypothetical protein